MADEDTAPTPVPEDDRLVIPLDPEEALKGFLKVDPADLPPEEGAGPDSGTVDTLRRDDAS
jgi:hypothetical protein